MRRQTRILVVALFLCSLPSADAQRAEPFDVLISGGQVLDGTGNSWWITENQRGPCPERS